MQEHITDRNHEINEWEGKRREKWTGTARGEKTKRRKDGHKGKGTGLPV